MWSVGGGTNSPTPASGGYGGSPKQDSTGGGSSGAEPCRFFLSGGCLRGEACPYSHDLPDERHLDVNGVGFIFNTGVQNSSSALQRRIEQQQQHQQSISRPGQGKPGSTSPPPNQQQQQQPGGQGLNPQTAAFMPYPMRSESSPQPQSQQSQQQQQQQPQGQQYGMQMGQVPQSSQYAHASQMPGARHGSYPGQQSQPSAQANAYSYGAGQQPHPSQPHQQPQQQQQHGRGGFAQVPSHNQSPQAVRGGGAPSAIYTYGQQTQPQAHQATYGAAGVPQGAPAMYGAQYVQYQGNPQQQQQQQQQQLAHHAPTLQPGQPAYPGGQPALLQPMPRGGIVGAIVVAPRTNPGAYNPPAMLPYGIPPHLGAAYRFAGIQPGVSEDAYASYSPAAQHAHVMSLLQPAS